MDLNIKTKLPHSEATAVTDESSPSSAGSLSPPAKKVKTSSVTSDPPKKMRKIKVKKLNFFPSVRPDEARMMRNMMLLCSGTCDSSVDFESESEDEELVNGSAFICAVCEKKKYHREHCFECKICGADNCKPCWPDARYWPTCGRCSGSFCCRCSDWQEYWTNGVFYCDHCFGVRPHNEYMGRDPSDSESATSTPESDEGKQKSASDDDSDNNDVKSVSENEKKTTDVTSNN